jgi:hypothetical protein
VVEDDVYDEPEAGVVEPLNHLPELKHARCAVRVGRVAAVRHDVVERVVAPVEGVCVAHRADGRLLLVGIGRIAREVSGWCQPRRLVFVDRRDVEGREDVDVRKPRLGERREVEHPVRSRLREGLERPA